VRSYKKQVVLDVFGTIKKGRFRGPSS
jgi:hypothetical protein